MTPIEIIVTALGVTMSLALPVALVIVVTLWAIDKWG
jgi:hypothetical protein